jgi:transposase-like protein
MGSGGGVYTRPNSRPRRYSSCSPEVGPWGQVARELDLAESLVRGWLRQAEVDAGCGPTGALTTAEKEELSKLRRGVKVLRMERES